MFWTFIYQRIAHKNSLEQLVEEFISIKVEKYNRSSRTTLISNKFYANERVFSKNLNPACGNNCSSY